MSNIVVRTARLEDAFYIAQNVRDSDRVEIEATSGDLPVPALARCYHLSTKSWTVMVDDKPAVIFGVAPVRSVIGRTGSPWLIATNDIRKIRKSFVKNCDAYLDQMLALYPELINYVDARNKTSIRWLKWLGFMFDEPVSYGIRGEQFYPFRRVG